MIKGPRFDAATEAELAQLQAQMQAEIGHANRHLEARTGFDRSRETYEAWEFRLSADLHERLEPLRHRALHLMAHAVPVYIIDAAALGGPKE